MGRFRSIFGVSIALVAALPAACNTSSEYHAPGPLPQITAITAPTTVNCPPECSGAACPLTIGIKFRLEQGHFVKAALVRFQRDGSDIGVDRPYPFEPVFDETGDGANATFTAAVPPNLVGTGTLFSYSVRLLTGRGDSSDESTLTVTVTDVGNEECRKRNREELPPPGTTPADAGG